MSTVTVDEPRLERDMAYRVGHFRDFIEFTEEDENAIKETLEKLGPHVPVILDGIYEHLFKWSSTAKYFVDEDGLIRDAFIRKRKETLEKWIVEVGKGHIGAELGDYLVHVGERHADNSVGMDIPRHYYVLLMSFVQTTLAGILHREVEGAEQACRAITAWNKMLMLSLEMMLAGATPNGSAPPESS